MKTFRSIKASHRRPRGSATILVIATVIIFLIIGLALVTIGQYQRVEGRAAARNMSTDAAVKQSIEMVRQALQTDQTNYHRASTSTINSYTADNVAGYGNTYPDPNFHPWLSPIEPSDVDCNGAWDPCSTATAFPANIKDSWGQVSNIIATPGSTSVDFVDGGTLLPLSSSATAANYTSSAPNAGSFLGLSITAATAYTTPPTSVTIHPTAGGLTDGIGIPLLDSSNKVTGVKIITSPSFSAGTTMDYTFTFNGGTGGSVTAKGFSLPQLPTNSVSIAAPTAASPTTKYPVKLPLIPTTEANGNIVADASNCGFADSMWIRLPGTSPDGLVTLAAVKIIDNSGLVNVNTAFGGNTTATNSVTDYYGDSPADINLQNLLTNADTSSTSWGTAFACTFNSTSNPATWGTDWDSVFTSRFTAAQGVTAAPNSDTTRLALWNNFGSKVATYLNADGNSTPASPWDVATPIGWADETQLRLRNGLNLGYFGKLETLLAGSSTNADFAHQGILRTYSGRTGYDAASPTRTQLASAFHADLRHLLTVYNGTANTYATSLSTPAYRKPMPYWLNAIDYGISAADFNALASQDSPTSTYGTDATLTSTGVPPYKLNPNTDSLAKLGYLFENLLRQGESFATSVNTLYPILPNSSASPTISQPSCAYMLAANLGAYRGPSVAINDATYKATDVNGSTVTAHGITYMGLRIQPFFTEAHYIEIYSDANSDGFIAPAEVTASVPTQRLFAVELRNPWPVSIDLSKFQLRYSGGTAVDLSGTIAAGDYIVIMSNDTDLNTAISTTHVPDNATYRLKFNFGSAPDNDLLMPRTGFTGSTASTGVFELIAKSPTSTNNRVVDRIWKTSGDQVTQATNWPRPTLNTAAFPVPGYTLPGGTARFGFETNIQRWWAYSSSFPLSSAGNNGYAQSFMIESHKDNVQTLASNTTDPPGYWRAMPAAGSGFNSAMTNDFANLGNNGSGTPQSKAGSAPTFTAAPTSLAWPSFQIPLEYSGTAITSLVYLPLDSVGELAWLPVVSHSANSQSLDETSAANINPAVPKYYTFSENLFNYYNNNPETRENSLSTPAAIPPLLNYGQFGEFYNATASTSNNTIRTVAPNIPVAMTIFDALDLVAPNQSRSCGSLNINTAPEQALQALPPLKIDWSAAPASLHMPNTFLGSYGIVAYRDQTDLTGMSSNAKNMPIPSSWTAVSGPDFKTIPSPFLSTSLTSRHMVFGLNYNDTTLLRQKSSSSTCENMGFVSLGELLGVSGSSTWRAYMLNTLATSGSNSSGASTGPLNFFPDQVANDTVDETIPFVRMCNLVDTHSDVFTAYVLLQTRKYDPNGLGTGTAAWVPVANRRYVATFDRGNYMSSGNNGTLNIVGSTITLQRSDTVPFTPDMIGKTVVVWQTNSTDAAITTAANRAFKCITTVKSVSTVTNPNDTLTLNPADPADNAITITSSPNPHFDNTKGTVSYIVLGCPKLLNFAEDR